MAQDDKLNRRIREILSETTGIVEKNMFGGPCFLHNGNMLCGCDLKNGLSVRVGPEQYEKALLRKHCRQMDLTGRPMKVLVFVEPEGYRSKISLASWIELGKAFTSTLPPKTPVKKASRKVKV